MLNRFWASLSLSLAAALICVAVGSDKKKLLSNLQYPQIGIYADGSLIIGNKITNGVEEYGFKEASKIQKLNLSCTYSSPIEWVFECPEDTFHISSTQQIVLDPVSGNYFYRSNIFLPQDRLQLGFNQSPENIVNVTCRKVENSGINTSVIFLSTKKNFTLLAHSNFEFNRGANCPNKNYLCPVQLMVDLHTATFGCYARNKTKLEIQAQILECHDRMDFCKSLAIASASCVTFTTRHTKFNYTFPSPTNKAGIVQCVTNNQNFTSALYYAVLGESNNPRVLTKTDVLKLGNRVLVLKSNSKDALYFDGHVAVFTCEAYTSVFAMGSVISYLHQNMSIIPLDNPGNEIVKTESNSSVYVKTVNFTINKDMIAIICNTSIAYSRQWKHTKLSISVTDAEKPRIVKHEIFPNGSMTVYKCDASGSPAPNVTWFNRTISDTDIGMSKARIKRPINLFGNSTYTVGFLPLNSTYVNYSTIICKAKNFIGHIEVVFGVKRVDAKESGVSWILYVMSVIIVIALVGLVITGFLLYKRRKQSRVLLTEEDCDEFYKGNKFINQSDPLSGALLLAYDINFEVPRGDITMGPVVLGSGQFGIVLQGRYQGTTVAVKTIRHTTDIKYFKALLAELKILQYLGHHPNIVNLVGACTTNIRKMEVLILLDYCENGNLVKFLRSCRSTFLDLYHHTDDDITRVPVYENNIVYAITTKDLLRFSLQVADACVFIADKKILHGDLACRNVLVCDKNIKICDFGLAKQVLQYSLYIQKVECPLPLRWMALESLQDLEFSIKSDCWSMGVLLWEIFSLAEIPYPGMDWNFESWRMLKDGYRMDKPEYCNKSIYQLMLECWNNDPQLRPTFSYLAKAFRDELDSLR